MPQFLFIKIKQMQNISKQSFTGMEIKTFEKNYM